MHHSVFALEHTCAFLTKIPRKLSSSELQASALPFVLVKETRSLLRPASSSHGWKSKEVTAIQVEKSASVVCQGKRKEARGEGLITGDPSTGGDPCSQGTRPRGPVYRWEGAMRSSVKRHPDMMDCDTLALAFWISGSFEYTELSTADTERRASVSPVCVMSSPANWSYYRFLSRCHPKKRTALSSVDKWVIMERLRRSWTTRAPVRCPQSGCPVRTPTTSSHRDLKTNNPLVGFTACAGRNKTDCPFLKVPIWEMKCSCSCQVCLCGSSKSGHSRLLSTPNEPECTAPVGSQQFVQESTKRGGAE